MLIDSIELRKQLNKLYAEMGHVRLDSVKTCVSQLEMELSDNWIPVSERLPKLYVRVLTCDKYGNMHIFERLDLDNYPFGIKPNNARYHTPVAWMPLPEPYVESEEHV